MEYLLKLIAERDVWGLLLFGLIAYVVIGLAVVAWQTAYIAAGDFLQARKAKAEEKRQAEELERVFGG